MWGDLHIHSRFSDGSQSVEELVIAARERGLTHISITDHDTTEGIGPALEAGLNFGITVIPGIEISAYDFKKDRKAHILGYYFRIPAVNIEKLCLPVRKARHENTLRQIKILAKAGYDISEEEVRLEAGPVPVLYKQHIMKALIRKGYTGKIYSSLYKELFKGDGICAGDIVYTDVRDAVAAVKADGGLAVLAHPGQTRNLDLVESLIGYGLDGIELNHEDNKEKYKKKIEKEARSRSLILTGGSDTHGSYGSRYSIGDITAPYSFFSCRPRYHKKTEQETVREIIKEAGDLLRYSVAETLNVRFKDNDHRNPVTEYDCSVEKFLVYRLSDAFPGSRFITEETADLQYIPEGRLWIIDPIDGTTNFISARKDFAVSVALYQDGNPVYGIVYDVMNNKLYEGTTGKGSALNGVPIPFLSKDIKLTGALADFSLNTLYILKKSYGIDISKMALKIKGHRAFGAASLNICRIAEGFLDCYLSAKLYIWDYAAALIILKECGGTAFLGDPPDNLDGVRIPRVFLAGSSINLLEEFRGFLKRRKEPLPMREL